jgi:hypothetical protein
MAGISIEVSCGTDRFEVAVRAHRIQQAMRIGAKRYPGSRVGGRFPVDPEDFFVEDSAGEGLNDPETLVA